MGDLLPECPYFERLTEENAQISAIPSDSEGVPWTGSVFGLDDIAWLASRERPLLYAPIGPHNAGKTTFLASLYIGLCRGVVPAKHQFVGSFSFGGWEKLAAYLRYPPSGIGPGFPPHTPVTENRLPGWLHVGLRASNGRIRDILIADTPGEWFSRWAIQADDEGAVGARWIARHADGFLFFVDSEALTGPNRRIVIENTELLAQRLSGIRGDRPVSIIWTKSDKEVKPQIREDLESSLKRTFPAAASFQISVYSKSTNSEPTVAFWSPLEGFLLRTPTIHPLPTASTTDPQNPFLAYRG